MAKSTKVETISPILDGALNGVAGLCDQMELAEDELSRAIRRHPSEADALFHGFHLLEPTHDLMTTDFVYRSHCRELLGRIAKEADTRPGTAAEACCVLRDCSVRAPLSSAAAGLYLRMWGTAFPEQPMFADSLLHHEMLEGSVIDTLEADTRLKLTVKNRKLRAIECSGRHNGRTVQCRFVTAHHGVGTTGLQLMLPGIRAVLREPGPREPTRRTLARSGHTQLAAATEIRPHMTAAMRGNQVSPTGKDPL